MPIMNLPLEKIYTSPYRSFNFQQLFFYDIFCGTRILRVIGHQSIHLYIHLYDDTYRACIIASLRVNTVEPRSEGRSVLQNFGLHKMSDCSRKPNKVRIRERFFGYIDSLQQTEQSSY